MADYLVFTLTATLAAMGELAGHERRPSLSWPGRSAILGLLAAARGVRREDAEGLEEMDRLKTAVAIFDSGTPLRDYHTFQSVPTAVARNPNSRPDALRRAGRRANTSISLRDYRQQPLFGVAVWDGELPPLRQALLRPCFTLYLGRKSCPLSAPLAPRIVEAEGPAEALAAIALPPWSPGRVARLMAVDAREGMEGQLHLRQDQPRDRTAWHFAARSEALVTVEIAPREDKA